MTKALLTHDWRQGLRCGNKVKTFERLWSQWMGNKKKPVPTQWNDNKSSKKNSIPAAESHINRIYLPWTRAGIYQADKWA